MDILAQITSEKYSNPIEFLNQLRQTTEPIGGGMEYSDNGEYVEYDVAVEAVKKAQKQGERKPTWSDEDEKIMKQIDSLLYCQCTIHSSMYEKLHNWLKSIKKAMKGE